MRHLREVAMSELDEAMRHHVLRTARQCQCNFTILEGLVTGDILIVMHKTARPSENAIEQYERDEFMALAVASEKQ